MEAPELDRPPRRKKLRPGAANRSLELMQLVRDERRLKEGPNWGKRLADRMIEAEGQPDRLNVNERVKRVVAKVPPSQPMLDLREDINDLSDEEIWSVLRSCGHATELNVSGWDSIRDKALRSVAVVIGDQLSSVDASSTPITDGMLQGLSSRLYSLHTVRLARCPLVGSSGLRDLTASCANSLTELDLSECTRVDDDCLGWVAGLLGHQREPCRRLKTLNLSDCAGISDKGLRLLSQSCARIQFLNLTRCPQVTDRGMQSIAKGCPRLRVCALHANTGIGDATLKAMAKHCRAIVSLNVSRCGPITDAGVRHLARSCANLQALNLAGAVKVTEKGLYELASHCAGLQTLNVTGCQEITLNGLRAAIEGLAYVTEAKSYFGFFPSKGAVERKLEDQVRLIECEAVESIQRAWAGLRGRGEARRELRAKRRERACVVIQRCYARHRRRMVEWRRREARKEVASATALQRVWRGKQDREAYGRRLARRNWFEAQGKAMVQVQAAWRGYWVRVNDRDVGRMLVALYEHRRHEATIAAAVFVQRAVRRFLSLLRISAWRELWRQRLRDRHLAALRLQCCGRAYVALRRTLTLQAERDRLLALRHKAAARIQAALRGLHGKHHALMTRAEVERLARLRQRRARDVQRAFRGFLGRELAALTRLEARREARAVTKVQAAWRGSRVLPWQGIKLNRVAAFVFRREELELEERAAAAIERNRERVRRAAHDSASSEEEEDGEQEWQELVEEGTGRKCWYSARHQEVRYEPPAPAHAFELGLVGLEVRIYWPMEDRWLDGKLSRYNRTKGRHRVEYPDGDHEWLDLAQEADRVQLRVQGQLVMYAHHSTPELEERQRFAAEHRRRERAHAERERLEDLWFVVGLDEAVKKVRWVNEATGEMRYQAEDFDDWVRFTDLEGHLAYRNAKTGEVLSCLDRDPRFERPVDSASVAARKQEIQQDLSMGVYLCSALIEEYYSVPDEQDAKRRKVMQRILSQPGHIKLKAGIRMARQVYSQEEFAEDPLCATGDSILKQYNALAEYGQQEQAELMKKKQELLKTDRYKEKAIYLCPSCSKQIAGNEVYCPICGHSVPAGLAPQLSS